MLEATMHHDLHQTSSVTQFLLESAPQRAPDPAPDKIWETMQGQDNEQAAGPDKFSDVFSIGSHMMLDAMSDGS